MKWKEPTEQQGTPIQTSDVKLIENDVDIVLIKH